MSMRTLRHAVAALLLASTPALADGPVFTRAGGIAAPGANPTYSISAFGDAWLHSVQVQPTGQLLIDPTAAMTDAQVPTTVCPSSAALAAGNVAVPGQACISGRFPNGNFTQFQLNADVDEGAGFNQVQFGPQVVARAGAGTVWNLNPVVTFLPGSHGGTNGEYDLNNFACDSGTFAAGTNFGGTAGCTGATFGLWLTGSSQFAATAALNIASAGGTQWHTGIEAIGPVIQDQVLFERTASAIGLDLEGLHSIDIDLHTSGCILGVCVVMGPTQGTGWYGGTAHYTTEGAYSGGLGPLLASQTVDAVGNYKVTAAGFDLTGTATGSQGSSLTDNAAGLILQNIVADYLSAPSTMFGTNGGLIADPTAPAQIYAPFGQTRGYTTNAQLAAGATPTEVGETGYIPGVGYVVHAFAGSTSIVSPSGALLASFNANGTVSLPVPLNTALALQGTATGAVGSTLTDAAAGLILQNTLAAYLSSPSTMFGTNGGLVSDPTAPAQIYAPFLMQRGYVTNTQLTVTGPSTEVGMTGWVPNVGYSVKVLVPGQPLFLSSSAGVTVLGGSLVDASPVPITVTSGASVPATDNTAGQILVCSGTLASLTEVLPPNPRPKQTFHIAAECPVTALTVTGGTSSAGASALVLGTPGSIGPASPVTFLYDNDRLTWVRW